MMVEIISKTLQEHQRCKYCLGTAYGSSSDAMTIIQQRSPVVKSPAERSMLLCFQA
ncbi:hypothetical protein RchiOBHm_Chr6g0278231 [Rosa chinensis]|uniref:Uncharacterized protein n=1 Tax=Rosa chinensis TaxID=74649 RepID=A0A2P6PSP8_ROSCH|nr:hypothetical protein RchiOBHm_Chr6g0278231 [Rosa chinensis]